MLRGRIATRSPPVTETSVVCVIQSTFSINISLCLTIARLQRYVLGLLALLKLPRMADHLLSCEYHEIHPLAHGPRVCLNFQLLVDFWHYI